MVLLRKDLKALGQKGHTGCMDGDLLRLGLKYFSGNPYNITYIILLEICIGILTDTVPGYIALDISL